MQLIPIKANNRYYNNSLENLTFKSKDDYSHKEKTVVLATTFAGIAASTALMAKRAGYSLKPKSIGSYLLSAKYEMGEVVSIGAGSCIGGLVGGYIIDKNEANRKAKQREALMHFGNIAIPIVTVGVLVDKVFEKARPLQKAIAGILGVTAGIFVANIVMNKLCNFIFKDNSNERGVKLTDLPAHMDDAVVAANYISDAKLIRFIGRFIPLALIFAGNESGNKKANIS